jgi:cytochrome b561
MSMTALAPTRYDRRTIALHWFTALLVVALWTLGQTIDWFPKGAPRMSARSAHIVLGALLALVICYRVAWRWASGRRLPPGDQGWLGHISRLAHFGLYLLLFSTVALGITNAWIRGDSIFDLMKIPALDLGNKQLRDSVENIHGLSANCLALLAAIHASAGLFHHFVWNDGVLRRMIPSSKTRDS